MRVVINGADRLTIHLAAVLIEENHSVVVIDADKEKLNALSLEVDCGLLHGDGSRPEILREAAPDKSDVLICLLGSDQDNIIATLVGRSLGFPKVITKIDDDSFEGICQEVGLEHTIVASRHMAHVLRKMMAPGD